MEHGEFACAERAQNDYKPRGNPPHDKQQERNNCQAEIRRGFNRACPYRRVQRGKKQAHHGCIDAHERRAHTVTRPQRIPERKYPNEQEKRGQVLALFVPSATGQIGAIAAGAFIGWYWICAAAVNQSVPLGIRIPRSVAVLSLGLFFVLLLGLPLLATASGGHILALVSSFYRSGALVFGGGHVVLPLLQQAVVPPGWVSNDTFLAGYGAAQAVPGPLFTFAAYLGTVMGPLPNGWLGGLICLVAI